MGTSYTGLRGRVALVTGGGRGIGRAIALQLAQARASVAVAARTRSQLEAVAAEITKLDGGRAFTQELDVTDPGSITSALERITAELGPIDILINNAGLAVSAPLSETDPELWERHIRVNLTGPYLLTRGVLPGMLKRRWGRIINIASTAGKQGFAYTAAYSASKHALIGFTRALALELAQHGITVNAVCPGFAATDLSWESARRIAEKTGRSYDEAVRSLASFSPQKRLIEPEEVARVAVMLAGDGARGISGQAIVVDGGAVQS